MRGVGCFKAAIDFWNDPEYAKARALMGDDESLVVERRVCVFEAETPVPEPQPGQGFWLNLVEEVKDQERFMAYAGAAVPIIVKDGSATLGPVVHQHAGSTKMVFAAALGFPSLQAAIDMYTKPEYVAARALGGMESSEVDVVNRTITCVEK